MDATRQDAWTDEEDVILAKTVLRYIREGKTQLEAFKDVARQLSRTSAACGFRWNATIRKKYDDAILRAKEERKEGVKSHYINSSDYPKGEEKDTLEAAILLLEQMKTNYKEQDYMIKKEQLNTYKYLEQENKYLKRRLSRYEQAWNEMGNLWSWVEAKSDM